MQLEFISDRRNTMITKLALTILLAIPSVAAAQGKLADQLRKAIVEEEANQKLDTAIEAYTKILAQYDEDRKVAATALFHLAECSRKLGQKEKAIAAYQRVLREFTDQAALANAFWAEGAHLILVTWRRDSRISLSSTSTSAP